jgi:hypothetical protein
MEVSMRRSGLMLAGALFALLTSAGTASAAFTGPGGAVHGCVSKRGALTVIAYRSKCHKGLRSVILGAQGKPGSAGGSTAQLTSDVNALKSSNATLVSEVGALQSDDTALRGEVNALKALLAGVTRSGNALVFSGMNVQLESGAGSTSATPNGLGNLIIGYNEHPGTQTGSNNLVLGDGNSFTSFGGLVAGNSNTISAAYATVTGGHFNLASDPFSSVAGGCENVAGGASALSGTCLNGAEAVLGGFENSATGLESTVSGGEVGTASGGAASIAGGQFGTASGGGASVAGGNVNTASGSFSSILGGFSNSATTFEATVSGGSSNTASAHCQAIPAAPGSPC